MTRRWFFIATEKQKKCSNLFTSPISVDKVIELKAQGLNTREMANVLGVSRTYLYKFRKENNLLESKRGKKSTVNTEQLIMLHNKGLSDEVIAQHMGISRSRVVKIRKKIGLPPNYKVGERGPGKLRDNVPYFHEVRRVFNDTLTARIIRRAAQKFREEGGSEETAWAATLIEPCPVFHPAPGSYCAPAEKTNLSHVRYAVRLETREDFAGLCGLPSIQLVEKALELRGLLDMAPVLSALVANSGYMGTHITTDQARERNPDSVHTWNNIWGRYLKESEKWAPVRKESRKKIQTYRKSKVSNGKKGKEGGRQNIQARQAYMGAAGY